jgi:hypothetical protein
LCVDVYQYKAYTGGDSVLHGLLIVHARYGMPGDFDIVIYGFFFFHSF